MIEIIDLKSDKAIGMRIFGKIEKQDIDAVLKEAESKLDPAGKIGVYVEVEEFKGFSMEALIEDLRFAIPNLKRFNKKAVVSDKKWMSRLAEIGDRLFPGIEVRHYDPDRKQEARDWICE